MMNERLLRLPVVVDRVGFSRASVYAKIKTGEFPPPVKIGARAVGWPETVIDEWIAEKIRGAVGGER